jgi:ATP-dependent RNA helicase DDX10/DBP4
LQKDKEAFNISDLPLEEYAESLGLPAVPHVKFMPGEKLKQAKNAPHPLIDLLDDGKKKPGTGKSRHEKMFERRNQTVLSKHYEELHSGGNTAFNVDESDDNDGEIFSKKRKVDWDETNIPTGQLPVSTLVLFLSTHSQYSFQKGSCG